MKKSSTSPQFLVLSTIFLFAIISSYFSFGQSSKEKRDFIQSQMVNPTESFEVIHNYADTYFRSLTEATATEDDDELNEFYRRWEYYYHDRSSFPNSRMGGDIFGANAKALALTTLAVRCTTGLGFWSSDGPNINSNSAGTTLNIGIIASTAFDPNALNTFYAGSNTGGLYKTLNAGVTWNNITDNFNFPVASIKTIAVDPTNSLHILLGVGAGVFRDLTSGIGIIETTNGGSSWATLSLPGLFNVRPNCTSIM